MQLPENALPLGLVLVAALLFLISLARLRTQLRVYRGAATSRPRSQALPIAAYGLAAACLLSGVAGWP